MDKTFQPQDIEQRWYQQWESKGFFAQKLTKVKTINKRIAF